RSQVSKQELGEAYAAISVTEGETLARYALALEDSDASGDVLLTLACFVPEALREVHDELVAQERYYPGELFRGASQAIAESIIERIAADGEVGSLELNHQLVALAWIGGEKVQAQFAKWRSEPPVWRDKLHVPPEEYSHEAGWELDTTGCRRQLFADECYTLVPSSESTPDIATDVCPWCKNQLAVLFDFDLRDPRLAFLWLVGTRLRIAICPNCTDFTTIYTEIDEFGKSRWSEHNQRPAYIGRDGEQPDAEWLAEVTSAKVLGEARRTPFEAHQYVTDWLDLNASQVGGFPAWVQDAEHPTCPICHQAMMFVAQFAASDTDGLIYGFLCSGCGIAATNAQYT
ncbi:MAG: hypothetical protein U0232_29930, partial [Thermomicrobiales bacterium]